MAPTKAAAPIPIFPVFINDSPFSNLAPVQIPPVAAIVTVLHISAKNPSSRCLLEVDTQTNPSTPAPAVPAIVKVILLSWLRVALMFNPNPSAAVISAVIALFTL